MRPLYPNALVILMVLSVLLILPACSHVGPDMSGYEPKAGDLAFRRGGSTKSMVVLRADRDGMYSHVGIVVETDSGFRVVHITPGEREKGQKADTIKIEPLERFFGTDRADRGEIARIEGDSAMCRTAAEHALSLFGQRILFDHDYDLEDSSRMYCTELVWHVYRKAGKDLTGGRRSSITGMGSFNGEHIFPADIYADSSLRQVYVF